MKKRFLDARTRWRSRFVEIARQVEGVRDEGLHARAGVSGLRPRLGIPPAPRHFRPAFHS